MRPCNILYIIHILFFPDRESTLFVVIKTVPFIPFCHHREVEDFFKTTRKCLIKKLALIPTTKLIIEHAEDYQLPPRVTRRKNFLLPETLKVNIVNSCRMELVLATILTSVGRCWTSFQCCGKHKGLWQSRMLPRVNFLHESIQGK